MRNDLVAASALLYMVGCGNPSAPRERESAVPATTVAAGSTDSPDAHAATLTPPWAPDAPPTSPVATPIAFHPDDDPACADLASLGSAIRAWREVASPAPPRRRARALWPTLPTICRGGTFFLAAAEMVGFADDANLPTADGTLVVHSPGDALARGLAAEPDHPRLLAHLALVDDLAPGLRAPPVPVDACTRAKGRGEGWADYAAYTCALAAIRAGDGATALPELERIRDVALFPDLKGRRAQALALTGKRQQARALVKPALAAIAGGWPFDIPEDAIAVLKKKLTAL